MNIYSSAAPTIAMGSLTPVGGQPHENRMPFLALNYCIALAGHSSVAQLRPRRPGPRSIEDDLIVLMIARRRVDGNEVEVKARALRA